MLGGRRQGPFRKFSLEAYRLRQSRLVAVCTSSFVLDAPLMHRDRNNYVVEWEEKSARKEDRMDARPTTSRVTVERGRAKGTGSPGAATQYPPTSGTTR